jgi:DNA-binding MarR family transcriptional regulator
MSVSSRATARSTGATGPADELERRLVATIPTVMRHLVAHARRRPAWRDGKLTFQQYNVLRIIHAEDNVGPAEVARRLMVTAPVVTRLVGGLVETGLVERRPDPADRRAVRLGLTAAGRRRSIAMRRALLAAATELIEPLPEERREGVSSALEELQVLLPDRGRKGQSGR